MVKVNFPTSEPIYIHFPGKVGIGFAMVAILLLCVSVYTFAQNINVQGNFENITVEHNVYDTYNRKGMRIHVRFTIHNKMGEKCRASATYYYTNGTPLKDFNNEYSTMDGIVFVSEDFVPGFENTLYEDFQLFMPYTELHMSQGECDLMFIVSLYNYETDTTFAKSQSQAFHFSNSPVLSPEN